MPALTLPLHLLHNVARQFPRPPIDDQVKHQIHACQANQAEEYPLAFIFREQVLGHFSGDAEGERSLRRRWQGGRRR